jgi:hypothetical protein
MDTNAKKSTHIPHLTFTVAELRHAFRQAGALPIRGRWYYYDDRSGQEYGCPLHVAYGVTSVVDAESFTGSPHACIASFIAGWDAAPPVSGECIRCYDLGARLRAELGPVWVEGR